MSKRVLEEYVDGQLAKTFTLGHDVLTQADGGNGPLMLIYDGHGSTRARVGARGGEDGGGCRLKLRYAVCHQKPRGAGEVCGWGSMGRGVLSA